MWASTRKKKNSTFKKKLFILFITIFLLSLSLFTAYRYSYLPKHIISPLPQNKAMYHNSTEELKILLHKNNISFSSIISSSDSAYLLIGPQGEEIVFSSKKNLDSQVSSLQLILSRLTIEGKGFKRLDLRFDKPVIVFK